MTESHLEGITMIKIKVWTKSGIENPQSDRRENIAESLEILCIGSPLESLKEKAFSNFLSVQPLFLADARIWV